MRIGMIGTGYVGLVSGACFADFGHQVVCVDKDAAKVAALDRGEIPIYEPGLEEIVERCTKAGRLRFTTDIASALAEPIDVLFIAVGTPTRRGTGHADLKYVFAAAEEFAPLLQDEVVVVTKSTVPVGTGDAIEAILKKHVPDRVRFAVVSNPEFLREGSAITDFKHPDRVVVGVEEDWAEETMRELYRSLASAETQLHMTRRRTAELVKYASNAFLAAKVAFINEIADLCEVVGADVEQVAHGVGLDSRIGRRFLNAGPGYGGSCFPKDTLAILRTAEENGVNLSIIGSVVRSNDARKRRMADKVRDLCGGSVEGRRVGLLGLTFKPNTDDMRDSPAIDIVDVLAGEGAEVVAYDPEGMDAAAKLMPALVFAENAYQVAEGADVLVLVTEWDHFRALDMRRVATLMRHPRLVDLRNVYSPKRMKRIGFQYVGVGKGTAVSTEDAST